jgi:polyisoprenoid-binding protein YceI
MLATNEIRPSQTRPHHDTRSRFNLDMKASLFTVQAFASGIASVIAHSPKFAIRDMSSDVVFDLGALEKSSVTASIRLGSLEIMDEVSGTDRREIERVMFDEVLENKLYPTAEFRSSRVSATKTGENMYRVIIAGELSLHGITRGLGFESQMVVGEETLRLQGSFAAMQSDYGLKIASVANGTLKLKNELKFGFFLVARRKS